MEIKRIRKSLVLQQEQKDCGVACLLSLIRYYGGDYPIEEIRSWSGAGKEGTTLLGLYEASQKTGFEAFGCQADLPALIQHQSPVILHLTLEQGIQHYVVCYGYENDKFCIGDPAKGVYFWTEEELKSKWPTGFCLTLKPNEEFKTQKNIRTSQLKWLYALLEKDLNTLLMSLLLGIVVAILGISMSLFSQKLIDDLLPKQDISLLFTGITLLCILLALRMLLGGLRQYLLNLQNKDFNERLVSHFFSKLLYLPLPFFDTRKTGDFTARLHDSARIQRIISTLAGSIMIDSLILIIYIAFLFSFHWYIGLFSVICLPILCLLVCSFHRPVMLLQKESMQDYALSESNFIESIQGIREIKNAGKENYFSEKNQKIYAHYQQKVFRLAQLNLKLNLLAGMGSVVFIIGILGIGTGLVLEDVLLPGQLMAVLGISAALLPASLNLSLLMIPLNEARVAFNRVFEFYHLAGESKEVGTLEMEGIEIESISIHNGTFRFPGRASLFENIGFSIHKNELCMLQGENGSGKSTLLSILMKHQSLNTGEIMINHGIPLSEMNTQSWRERTAYVAQEPRIFNGSLFENIAMQSLNAAEESHIIAFCKALGFHTWFSALPQAYHTLLGEEGIHLSGGQKQLLALARALYQQPQILLLDEPTSAMDPATERFVMNLMHGLKKDRLVLWVSHQVHLQEQADRVWVLQHKSLQEKVRV